MRAPYSKQEALKRLSYIEGHLKGIRRMVEEDESCVDVLKQTYAVRCAIEKFDTVLLHGHLEVFVPESLREGKSEYLVDELGVLFALSRH